MHVNMLRFSVSLTFSFYNRSKTNKISIYLDYVNVNGFELRYKHNLFLNTCEKNIIVYITM